MVGSVRNLKDDTYFDDMFDDEQPDENKKLVEPIPLLRNGWASYGDYRLVGNGEVTNGHCGQFIYPSACSNIAKHGQAGLDGCSHAGKVYVELVHNWCGKPDCKVCFKHGWAVREAGKVDARINEASKRFGQAEHIVLSVPTKDYGLDLKVLRSKAYKILKSLGVVGGVLIPHAFRYNLRKGWYFSPHWHIVGFILGGYSMCRNCPRKSNCDPDCGGFDDRKWKNYQKTGYVTKIMGVRRTIMGTAWYQLNHSSYKIGGKRHVVAVWFGCCSYRKLKVAVEFRKRFCKVCGDEMVRHDYSGSVGFVTDRLSLNYKRSFFADFVEDGVSVWAVKVRRSAVARITEADYFHFPSKKVALDFESQKMWAGKREKLGILVDKVMPGSEVWHGGLPKRQFV